MRKVLCLSVIVLIVAAMVSDAAIPRKVDYQGRLMDKNSKPVDGAKSMVFALYDVAVGGTALYIETQSVTVAKGIFNVTIGSVTPIPDIEAENVWLQVTVEGEVLSSRKQLVTVPFAFAADHADHADVADYATSATAAQTATSANYAVTAGAADTIGGLNLAGLDGRFVNVSGDSMTGALTVNSMLTSSNAMINWDATVNRILLVAPGGVGGIEVGKVEQFVGNADIAAANNLRADGYLYLGSSKYAGSIYMRGTGSSTSTVVIDGAGGDIDIAGDLSCDLITASGSVTGYDLIANHDGRIYRNLYVCPDTGIGGIIVGSVQSSMTNGDIGAANNLVADGIVTSGRSGKNGGVTVRNSSNVTTFNVAGSTGNVSISGTTSSTGAISSSGNVTGNDLIANHDGRIYRNLYVCPDTGIGGVIVGNVLSSMTNGDIGAANNLVADGIVTSGRSGKNGGITVRNSSATTTFSVAGSTGDVTTIGDINFAAGNGADFATNSGSIWQMYGSNASGANKLYISGPSNGEFQIDAYYAIMTLGSSTTDTLRIPATIEDGIIVKDNVGGGADSCAIRAENTHANGIGFTGRVTSTDGCAVLINKGTGDIIKGFSGAAGGSLVFEVRNNGRVVCSELEITGGADLAEPFKAAAAEPGMVMSIDPTLAGELRVSAKPYDRTVAGIVSGANGIKPGMTMKQSDSAADGNLPVALSGRVYCWCDASNGAIQPGDLLTTSSTPGHAMKVTDHARATGATIGKAMTSLESGRGLVLVLVNLQ